MTVIRQVTLDVPVERQEALAAFFRDEYRPAMARQPGFVAARLLKAAEVPTELQILLEFESEAQAAAWRASPDHVRLSPQLKAFTGGLALKVFSPLA